MKYFLILLALVCGSATAQRLLSNGTFDQNINSWENDVLSPTWISNDGAPASGNGSLRFGDSLNNGGSVWLRSELVPVKEGYQYIMASSYKLPNSSVANGLGMSVYWYDDMENYLGEYPFGQSFNTSQADVWGDYDLAFEHIVTGASQARVYLWVHMPSQGTDESFGLFDDVILFQDTVFVSDFD